MCVDKRAKNLFIVLFRFFVAKNSNENEIGESPMWWENDK